MKPLKDHVVALVGGAGFIGHNMAIQLKAAGYEPHVIDGLQVNNFLSLNNTEGSSPHRELYLNMVQSRLNILRDHQIPVHIQDARDYHALSNVLSKIEPDSIILLAAVAHAGKANKDPFTTFDHSLRTLENALDYSRGARIKHFVYFSSSMVYGNFVSGYVTEESPCNPIGIYGALKFAGEKMVIAYNQVFDLPYTIIRPSALYGPRCISRRVGQIFIESALAEKPITIKGDGHERLDFTYIKDLVHGVQCVLESKNAINETFNLTYGDSRSINQMATILREHFPTVELKYESRDRLMPERGTLSVDKAKQLIGYRPQFALERGFVDYINWYKENWHQWSKLDSATERLLVA